MNVFRFLLQLLDVFGQKSNVSLVFDFMDTDLEVSKYFNYQGPELHNEDEDEFFNAFVIRIKPREPPKP